VRPKKLNLQDSVNMQQSAQRVKEESFELRARPVQETDFAIFLFG
jgi:hypothetical protein